jgi:bleomycin hydrolase
MKYFNLIIIAILMLSSLSLAQDRRDKGTFAEKKDGFWDQIKKEMDEFAKMDKPEKKSFKMDFTGMDLPTDKEQFTYFWHNDPISQGNTGTCWCFSTTSYFESEIYRLSGQKIKLSELYTVYWEYVAKARRYVQERGDSEFGEGSESNAVVRIWREYGVVPAEAYGGKLEGQVHHDHSKMFAEMETYLKSVKEQNAWNEEQVVATIKSIMNHWLGVPPAKVQVKGKWYTPQEYLAKVTNLKLDDYVDILSILEQPYYQSVEYTVPDNWWHNADYHNVPLDDFMVAVKKALKSKYTIVIGGDVSEAGYESWNEVAMVPTFDIPSEYIDEHAREFRFANRTTTDDHGIHMVGYLEKDGVTWFLIKDSGAGSRNGNNKGYYFYHEDYVKLKIMDFMVHKDVVSDLLKKFE